MNAEPSKPVLPTLGALALVTALAAGPAMAHHAGGVFDRNAEVRLMGVVKAVEWTNPHAWIELNVAHPAGKTVQWSVELDSPTLLVRHGWRAGEVKAGDRVTVIAHPMKDGRPTGSFISVFLPNGKVLGRNANPTRGA